MIRYAGIFASVVACGGMFFGGNAGSTELAANYSAPASGTDMWTGYMGRSGLFVPHYDDCDTVSEAFVSVSPDGKGFCIEASSRPAAVWEEARHACMQVGMRLPEVAEFKFACKQAGTLGLSGMTDGWEWVSNYASPVDTGTAYGSGSTVGGNGGCGKLSWTWVGRNYDGVEAAIAYRCVR